MKCILFLLIFQLKALMLIECKYIHNAIMIFTEKYKWCCHKKILHEIPKAANLICITDNQIHVDTTVMDSFMRMDTSQYTDILYESFCENKPSLHYTGHLTILDNFWSIGETLFPHNHWKLWYIQQLPAQLKKRMQSDNARTRILFNAWNDTSTSK